MTRNVVITGASSGIGKDAVITLNRKGYNVIPTVRSHVHFEQYAAMGFKPVLLDLHSQTSVNEAYNSIAKMADNKLYALINNAYFGLPGAVEDLSPEALKRQFDCLFSSFHLVTLLMPIFRRQQFGRIIQVSSVLGFSALPFRGAYGASKPLWNLYRILLGEKCSFILISI